MICLVRQLHQLRIPLYTCFVELTKAYDSVNRTLLWKGLAWAGVPPKMLAVIRHFQFQNGMRARIRTGEDKQSGWLGVEQDL